MDANEVQLPKSEVCEVRLLLGHDGHLCDLHLVGYLDEPGGAAWSSRASFPHLLLLSDAGGLLGGSAGGHPEL